MDTEERISELARQRADLRNELARLNASPLDPTDTAELARRAAQRDRLLRALAATTGEFENLFRRRARDEERAAGLAELALLDERLRQMFNQGKIR